MILVVSGLPWVAAAFAAWRPERNYQAMPTMLVTTHTALCHGIANPAVEVVVFPHWSHHIEKEIYETVPCIGFHLGDLPQGRGGTPLQNLLVRGIYKTSLCAFKITEEMDAGPVYLREPVDLSEGSAEAIYHDLARRALRMAQRILTEHIEPQPQVGRPTVWRRRTLEESRIPAGLAGPALYDFIRMLDAPGYPRAFVEVEGRRLLFSGARLTPTGVLAVVEIGGVS